MNDLLALYYRAVPTGAQTDWGGRRGFCVHPDDGAVLFSYAGC